MLHVDNILHLFFKLFIVQIAHFAKTRHVVKMDWVLLSLEMGYHYHHHQFDTNECNMNNKIHDRAHTIIQKDTKRRITQTKLIQKNKTENFP